MNKLNATFQVEFKKAIKSKILLVTIIIFLFIPLMMGLMLYISTHPEVADKLGIIGTKAKMFGENTWQGYFALLSQSVASLGLIGFGFVTCWVYGREHNDRTMKDILSLPVPRSSYVFAKMMVVFLWSAFLSVILFAVSISLGLFLSIPGWSSADFISFSTHYFASVFLTFLLCSPIAWLSGYSRGIIAPLGFVIFTMIMAQFIGIIGLGPYFPWAIPGLFSVAKEGQGMEVTLVSFIILSLTFIIGYIATVRWWYRADHH